MVPWLDVAKVLVVQAAARVVARRRRRSLRDWTRCSHVPASTSPDGRPRPVRFAGRGPVTFAIDQSHRGRPDLRYQLTLNRSTAEVVRFETFADNTLGRRVSKLPPIRAYRRIRRRRRADDRRPGVGGRCRSGVDGDLAGSSAILVVAETASPRGRTCSDVASPLGFCNRPPGAARTARRRHALSSRAGAAVTAWVIPFRICCGC